MPEEVNETDFEAGVIAAEIKVGDDGIVEFGAHGEREINIDTYPQNRDYAIAMLTNARDIDGFNEVQQSFGLPIANGNVGVAELPGMTIIYIGHEEPIVITEVLDPDLTMKLRAASSREEVEGLVKNVENIDRSPEQPLVKAPENRRGIEMER